MFNKARTLLVTLDEKTYMNLIGYYGKAGTGLLWILIFIIFLQSIIYIISDI